eukprot:3817769-Pyramimonas_sp.AAC.1
MSKHCYQNSNATDQPDFCVLTIVDRARMPFLGSQHRQSTQLFHPQNLESVQQTSSGTLIAGIRETLAICMSECAWRQGESQMLKGTAFNP